MLTVHQISRQQLWAVSERLNLGSTWQYMATAFSRLEDGFIRFSSFLSFLTLLLQIAATPWDVYGLLSGNVAACQGVNSWLLPQFQVGILLQVLETHGIFKFSHAIKIRTTRQPGYKSNNQIAPLWGTSPKAFLWEESETNLIWTLNWNPAVWYASRDSSHRLNSAPECPKSTATEAPNSLPRPTHRRAQVDSARFAAEQTPGVPWRGGATWECDFWWFSFEACPLICTFHGYGFFGALWQECSNTEKSDCNKDWQENLD